MKVRGIDVPEDLHVLVEHQVWARLEEPGVARVGITALGMSVALLYIRLDPRQQPSLHFLRIQVRRRVLADRFRWSLDAIHDALSCIARGGPSKRTSGP